MLFKCVESKNNVSLEFTVPAIWEKPQNERDCYFCMNDAKKWGIFNNKWITYNTVSSFIVSQIKKKPVDIPVDAGTSQLNDKRKKAVLEHETGYFTRSSEDSNIECETYDDEYTTYATKRRHSERWSQKELNDLIRDLRLPKDGDKHLDSALKEKKKFRERDKVKYLSRQRTEFSEILSFWSRTLFSLLHES